MSQAAAKTGVGPTAMAAIEQYFPQGQRIISDELAYPILPSIVRSFVLLTRLPAIRHWMIKFSEKKMPGLWGGILCRKRYIDEKLIEAQSQIDMVVNLGAGFDTRVYRLPALSQKQIWEVDQAENIEAKTVQLNKLFGNIPSHVTLVPIDFDIENLDVVLAAYNYSLDRRTFFIWEAVTQYLIEPGIKKTFEFLSHAAAGSRLVFTYLRKDFLDGQVMYGQEELYSQYVVKDKLWLFGLDPKGIENLLSSYGWRLIEHLGYDELANWYIPTGRSFATTEVERVVYAEKI